MDPFLYGLLLGILAFVPWIGSGRPSQEADTMAVAHGLTGA